MTTHWASGYVGLPFVDLGRDRGGCDCYGLVRLVYREQLGIELPAYLDYASAEEAREVAQLIEGAAALPDWRWVEPPYAPFDVLVFRRGGLNTHLGLAVAPGRMLHMVDEDAAKVERIAGVWASRLVGAGRHATAEARR